MELRDYQRAAVEAVYRHLRERDDNPVVVLPVGAGKSLVIAQIATDVVQRWNGRILVVTHSAELVEQNADKMYRLCPDLPLGIYCAGLRQRATESPVISASIQSVYQRACELGPFDLVVVDEAHSIPADGEGMYRQFLADARVVNPQLRICGTTATPYRLSSGPICRADGILNHVCYEVGLRELINRGFLVPLVSKSGAIKVDTSRLHVRGGEYVADEIQELMDDDSLVNAACAEIVDYTSSRKACLIFAAGVNHGRHVAGVIGQKHGIECGFVCSETPAGDREQLLTRFRAEPGNSLVDPLRYLCNYGILTTGFDAPRIDCIAILRPTMSPGLLVQMVGRGTRLHPGKDSCLVLDYGGNILRHGPIDRIQAPDIKSFGTGEAPAKECPECHSVIAAGYTTCPDCGYTFPPPESTRHDAEASEAGILSGEVTKAEYDVQDVWYRVHTKRGAPIDAPKTMRVDYRVGLDRWQSEWVCFEHTGYARRKAEAWWRARSPDPVPDTSDRAVEVAEAGGVALTEKITVRSVAGEKFDRIVGYKLGAMPEPVPTLPDVFEDVPF